MFITCLEIFAARIVDVSLGTLRTVYFVKGKTIEPFVIAFFEVLIWYIVAKEALNIAGNTFIIGISYASGYATGTLIGTKLSRVLINGIVSVQVVVNDDNNLASILRDNGYGVSTVKLYNTIEKDKYMLYIEVNNKDVKKLIGIIKKYDNNAFIIESETRKIYNGFVK